MGVDHILVQELNGAHLQLHTSHDDPTVWSEGTANERLRGSTDQQPRPSIAALADGGQGIQCLGAADIAGEGHGVQLPAAGQTNGGITGHLQFRR